MHVKTLDYTVYESKGWGWKSHKIPHPSWKEIEQAIRRLDRFEYPFLHLWSSLDEEKHSYDEGEVFEVIGGKGAYWLAGTFDGYFQRQLDYPEQGEVEVDVWQSDQGFAVEERHVCHDIETVIKTARYYFEHGGFDPAMKWESEM